MRQTVLIVIVSLAGAWAALVLMAALLMSTGLADTPGSTNGLRRFFWYLMYSIPAIPVIVFGSIALARGRRADTHGFPVVPPVDHEKRDDAA